MATYTGIEVGEAIYNVLANDAQVAASVASWKGGPAIFTKSDDAPGDATLPRIVSLAASETARRLSLDDPPFRSVTRQVNVWGLNNGTQSPVIMVLAERVARILDGGIDLGAGFHTAGSSADGPIIGLTENDNVINRVVTVTVWFQEE